jgi:hypothetical protein
MPVNWTIKGEAEQGWDESVTSLEARSISSAKLDFKSLDSDQLTFNVVVEDITQAEYVATPVISPDSSVQIGSTVDVTITCATDGSTIRYTTDGSNPNSSSPTIANGGTLTIANPSTLKVFAEKSGLLDSDTNVAEYVVQGVVATGGLIDDVSGYRIHTFLSSDTFVVTNPGTIEYLVVAGGGSGGGNSSARSGGGGGAGGFKAGTIAVTVGTHTITVGAGGIALAVQDATSDGGSSSIGTLVSCSGGGAGASVNGTAKVNGRNGGSGGGSTCAGNAGTGITGQGRNGGGSASSGYGTGGGSGAAGGARTTAIANGGAGTSSNITGNAVTYSIGGGGSLTPDVSVVPNTGNGGAGAFKSTNVRVGANGSSGIVVIKYATVQSPDPSNIPSQNSLIPSLRQEMTLYRDGVSFFFGNVTNIRSIIESGSHEFQVTVSGPWWFLENVPFTSQQQDSSGKSSERITYVFGTATSGQNLKTSIEAAINRSNELGCPIAPISGGSSVAAMHAFPRITLNQSTCGQVISELIRLVPDAMAYFDYSSYPAKLKVTRRPTASEINFDQNSSPITSIDINPIIGLEVQEVILPSVARDAKGLNIYKTQKSGDNQAGKNITRRQIITISGTELDTYLPNSLFDNQTITTASSVSNLVHDGDSACVTAAANAGLSRLPIYIEHNAVTLVDSRRRPLSPPSTQGDYTITKNFTVGGYSLKNKSGNNLSGYSILTTGKPADWTGIKAIDATISGKMYIRHAYDTGYDTEYRSLPTYVKAAGFTFVDSGYTSKDPSGNYVSYWQKSFSLSVVAAPVTSSSQTVYKPGDYSFINPPTGLADFLKSTQNWIPYEGTISIEEQDVGGTIYRGKKINIINSIPAYSTMGALVSGESLEIESGRTTVNIGSPARNDYKTIVDKIRKTSQDNIVYV